MNGELSKILKDQFGAAQEEYRLFYHYRNHPAADIEYEEREALTPAQRAAWAARLNDQALEVTILLDQLAKSADILDEADTLRTFRPYHEMKAYFGEDVRALRNQIGTFGFAPALELP